MAIFDTARHLVRRAGHEAGYAATLLQARGAGVALTGPEAILFLIPAMLPILLLSLAPLLRGMYLGFTDSRAGLDIETNFIGLDNFQRLIHDDLFINSFKIGVIWAVTHQ